VLSLNFFPRKRKPSSTTQPPSTVSHITSTVRFGGRPSAERSIAEPTTGLPGFAGATFSGLSPAPRGVTGADGALSDCVRADAGTAARHEAPRTAHSTAAANFFTRRS
jgi:hypothetical protein